MYHNKHIFSPMLTLLLPYSKIMVLLPEGQHQLPFQLLLLTTEILNRTGSLWIANALYCARTTQASFRVSVRVSGVMETGTSTHWLNVKVERPHHMIMRYHHVTVITPPPCSGLDTPYRQGGSPTTTTTTMTRTWLHKAVPLGLKICLLSRSIGPLHSVHLFLFEMWVTVIYLQVRADSWGTSGRSLPPGCQGSATEAGPPYSSTWWSVPAGGKHNVNDEEIQHNVKPLALIFLSG